MGSVKPHGNVFQLSSSGEVSKIEPALQDTVVAAIAGPGIVARVLAGTRDILSAAILSDGLQMARNKALFRQKWSGQFQAGQKWYRWLAHS